MAGPKANLLSFYLRRIARILPVYYTIHFLVLLANGQAWTTDFKERVGRWHTSKFRPWGFQTETIVSACNTWLSALNGWFGCMLVLLIFHLQDTDYQLSTTIKLLFHECILHHIAHDMYIQDCVLMLCTWHGSSPSTNFPAWTVCALVWHLCQRF